MPHEIVTIPCLEDNYAFLIGNTDTKEAALIDVPDAKPILTELFKRDWRLTTVLLTHHHWDHVDGLPDLQKQFPLEVVGAAADTHRLPALTREVSEGDTISICGLDTHIIDVSGHTIGHIAFHCPQAKAVFTADSLMATGCGRLFEGTPAQMFQSMQKLAALPDDTTVYSGHEYTETNTRFAMTIEPANPALISRSKEVNAARQAGRATVPSTLSLERKTNPFLRAHEPTIAHNLDMPDAEALDVFTEIRKRRDTFR